MATWPAGLPAPQKKINITPGNTRVERKLQSGRTEFRRFGDGKPDQAKVLFRLTWAQWETLKHYYDHDLNLGLNWFSADWLTTLGYDDHKAKILGYPREVATQNYYVDVLCILMLQKSAWVIGSDTEWPCAKTGESPPPPSGYGYIFGGYNSLRDCDEYIHPDTWTSKTDIPLPGRDNFAASTIGSSGYIYGGKSYLQDCDQYTPDTWTSKSDMPLPGRGQFAASTIGSSGYIYGGNGNAIILQDCDQYTPDTWISKTDLPAPARYYHAASTIGSSGYIYGGGIPADLQDCDQYTPDTWTSKTDMPLPARDQFAASTIGNSGYVYGGYYPNCDQYTPDTWISKTDLPAPADRRYLAASTIGNSGYIYGGQDSLQDCDQYTPDTWTSIVDLPAPGRKYHAASTI